jgi:hypothetical protein
MVYCENKTKGVVKIDGEVVHISNLPPITIELIPEGGCSLYYVECLYEYKRYANGVYDEEWLETGFGKELFDPLQSSLRITDTPENNGFKIEIYCRGEKKDGCGDLVWVRLIGYANEKAQNAQITRFDLTLANEEGSYLLKVVNKEGVEEFVKRFSRIPDYEVICGCDIVTELECKSDNELGFCCIPCDQIISKLTALKNKLGSSGLVM